jgi:hypothetical protein
MRGVGSLLPGLRRRRHAGDERPAADLINGVPEREFPYDIPASQVDAYRDAAAREGLAPRLTFTTARAAETRPMQVVPVAVPDIAPVCAQAATTDPADLARALPAIQEIDFDAVDAAREVEGATHVSMRDAMAPQPPVFGVRLDPEEAPAPSRADLFTADMRFGFRGLPLFRRTARDVGWRGLNEDPPVTGWPWYTVARWDQQARVAIAAATEAALAEVHADFEAARQRVMAPGHAPAGAA